MTIGLEQHVKDSYRLQRFEVAPEGRLTRIQAELSPGRKRTQMSFVDHLTQLFTG